MSLTKSEKKTEMRKILWNLRLGKSSFSVQRIIVIHWKLHCRGHDFDRLNKCSPYSYALLSHKLKAEKKFFEIHLQMIYDRRS